MEKFIVGKGREQEAWDKKGKGIIFRRMALKKKLVGKIKVKKNENKLLIQSRSRSFYNTTIFVKNQLQIVKKL